ncbi:ribosomal protein S19 (apicoplast) [Babesia microti strain RI]|uniref:Ribosomal protein S19 n=1 Tax=Babesia microti (strain RI) TaxID=1133968 RepID=A0A068W5Y3_BABMR|nr:ribosomal protein S19 [Babesia microti strain RI]CDR32589.1 ribosomal protein S19 [Babesia microti strain RI]|eukprot:YP_009363158.1 ribosomal protein S19 (apicoplast) [Babesia microti strain RI]
MIFDKNFYRKINNKNKKYKKFIIKTRNRNILLTKYLLNSILKVYNGKSYIPIIVNYNKLNYKLKNFIYTINKRKFFKNKFIKKCQK